jgi:hypothetical protein
MITSDFQLTTSPLTGYESRAARDYMKPEVTSQPLEQVIQSDGSADADGVASRNEF